MSHHLKPRLELLLFYRVPTVEHLYLSLKILRGQEIQPHIFLQFSTLNEKHLYHFMFWITLECFIQIRVYNECAIGIPVPCFWSAIYAGQ